MVKKQDAYYGFIVVENPQNPNHSGNKPYAEREKVLIDDIISIHWYPSLGGSISFKHETKKEPIMFSSISALDLEDLSQLTRLYSKTIKARRFALKKKKSPHANPAPTLFTPHA